MGCFEDRNVVFITGIKKQTSCHDRHSDDDEQLEICSGKFHFSVLSSELSMARLKGAVIAYTASAMTDKATIFCNEISVFTFSRSTIETARIGTRETGHDWSAKTLVATG